MNLREKVIKGLELCTRDAVDDNCICANCPYFVSMQYGCNRQQMEKDALELLSPVPPDMEGGGFSWYPVCGACHGVIGDMDSYCKHCGTPVLKEKAKPHHNKGGEEE